MINTVIFDLDGTLTDTRYAVLNALKATISDWTNYRHWPKKNNAQQIKLCFDAHYAKNWNTIFD